MQCWFIYNCLNDRGKKISFQKSDPSNLLVDRAKSMVKFIIFVMWFVVKNEQYFRIAMFESGKCWYYLTVHDKFYLNCSGVCDVYYYTRDSGGKVNYRLNIIAAVTYRVDWVFKLYLNLCSCDLEQFEFLWYIWSQ